MDHGGAITGGVPQRHGHGDGLLEQVVHAHGYHDRPPGTEEILPEHEGNPGFRVERIGVVLLQLEAARLSRRRLPTALLSRRGISEGEEREDYERDASEAPHDMCVTVAKVRCDAPEGDAGRMNFTR